MKLWTISTLLAGIVAAKDALVIVPHSDPSAASDSLSPTTARHIFAQRLGLGSLDAIKDVNEETIRLLNAYGGSSQQLFAQNEQKPSLLVMVEGVQDPKGTILLLVSYTAGFYANQVPLKIFCPPQKSFPASPSRTHHHERTT